MRKFNKIYPAWIPLWAGLILFLYLSIPQQPSLAAPPPSSANQNLQSTSAPTNSASAGQATASPTPEPTPTATQPPIPTLRSNILQPSTTPTGQGNSIGGSSSEVIMATATGQPTQPIPATGSGGASNCFLGGSLVLAFLAAMWRLAKILPR